MELNTISPGTGAKKSKSRVGRGIGSGSGKTCGRGHKGQKSRSGGYHKVGFEGGQMPLQRRVPKFGFTSRKSFVTDEVRLSELNKLDVDVINLEALKNAGIVGPTILKAKVILSGEVTKKLKLQGLPLTKGAKAAVEKAGGSVE